MSNPIENSKRRCTATNRAGSQCGRAPIPGGNVCALHGGKAPQVRQRAALRLVETESRSLLARLGKPEPLDHPVKELLAVAAESRAWLTVLRERLDGLDSLTDRDRVGIDRELAIVTLYGQALDRTARMLAELVKLGLEERMTRIADRDAQQLFQGLERAMAAVGLTTEFKTAFKQALASELRAMEASA